MKVKIKILIGLMLLFFAQNLFCQTNSVYTIAPFPRNNFNDLYSQTLLLCLDSVIVGNEQFYSLLKREQNKNGHILVQLESKPNLDSLPIEIGNFKLEYFYAIDHAEYKKLSKHFNYYLNLGLTYFNDDSLGVIFDFIVDKKLNNSANRTFMVQYHFNETENRWVSIHN